MRPGGHAGTEGLSRWLVALIAVATGAIVANLYYAQPVLHQVSRTFHSGPGATSSVITATQVGYAAGLLLDRPAGRPPPAARPRDAPLRRGRGGPRRLRPGPQPLVLRPVLGRGRCRLGGRPGHDPLRRRHGPRGAAGTGRGPDHDRSAHGHPARPHRLGLGRPGGRVAGHLLALGGAHGLLRRRALARPAGRGRPPAPQLPRTRRLVAPPARHRAGAAPAGLARRLRLRHVQRAVDDAGLLALGQPLPLLQRGDRPLRAGGRRRDRGGQPGRQVGRRRAMSLPPPSLPASC